MDKIDMLKELLREADAEYLREWCDNEVEPEKGFYDYVAGFLLANGVIVPPCKIGTHLWKVTHPYRQEPKVTEFVVKNFRTTGKKHTLQIEVQAVNVSGTNWMQYKDFCSTREEAEAKLREKSE